MDMLMIVFRTSLKERVHELLRTCGVIAYTEFPETMGTGQSGSTEGISFYAGGTVSSWSRWNQLNVTRSPTLSWPGVQRRSTQDGSNQPSGYFPGPAHSSLSRMLNKSASATGRYLVCLVCLVWLVERN